MEEAAKLLGMAIAGGLFAVVGRFVRDRWKYQSESRAQESKLTIDESREQQKLSQQGESYVIKQMQTFQLERQRVHEADKVELIERYEAGKREILGHLGGVIKELRECREGHTWGRIIQVRMIEFMRQKYAITPEQERDLFRPVEVWEKVADDKRVEDAKKLEDDSAN